jgi:hypothetical protein
MFAAPGTKVAGVILNNFVQKTNFLLFRRPDIARLTHNKILIYNRKITMPLIDKTLPFIDEP